MSSRAVRWASLGLLAALAGLAGADQGAIRPLWGPPPTSSPPYMGRLTVFLCIDDPVAFRQCSGKNPVTEERKHAVEAAIRGLPGVRRVRFATSAERYRELLASDIEFAEAMGVEGTPSTFEADILPGDWAAIRRRLQAYPGVLEVAISREWFSAGMADVTVLLCWPATAEDRRKLSKYARMDKVCRGRGAATAPEKAEVLARLHAMPQVDRIYFDGTAHAREAFLAAFGARSTVALPEAFYLVFDQKHVLSEKAGIADVERALHGMGAVASVTPA